MAIWNEKAENMDRDELRALQLEKLKKTVRTAYDHVALYRHKMDEAGVTPEDIGSLDDISKIPFTTKQDLREHYPFGLAAVPMRDIVRIHASSGTTGKPITACYTKKDLEMWAECIARVATAGGATADDIAQISFGYTLFTGAFGLHYGLEKIGCAIIPISSGNTERQLNIMKDFGTTVLIATPSYAMYMAEVAEKMGVMKDIHMKCGIFGAEASTEELRQELQRRWGCVVTENYGLTELLGPGVAGECMCRKGMHINEDYFYAEIIDPITGKVLPDGETGELVLTSLEREGQPSLRYRTRDITHIITEPCECGRTSHRIAKITGRSDDMLIIRGVNVFPSQIESVLLTMEGIGPNYEIVVTRHNYTDYLEVKVELIDAAMLDRFSDLENLQKKIVTALRTVVGIDIKVSLVSPSTLKRFEGKAKRVTDLR
ncbi:MAG: phenylacetate--CoA ligase [Eubacteriales bacterium]|nr:phenylacetate--CoA ligase [Eubacteriales bacterium]MDD4513062.1 phenylacetate--CoA ligase [Eubacteriales bacterium]